MLCTAGGAERSYVAQTVEAMFLFCQVQVRSVKVQSVRVNLKTFHSLTLRDTFWTFTQKLPLQLSSNYFASITMSSTTFLQHISYRLDSLGGVALQRNILLTSKSFNNVKRPKSLIPTLKYLIFSFTRSGKESKRGVESLLNSQHLQNSVESGERKCLNGNGVS